MIYLLDKKKSPTATVAAEDGHLAVVQESLMGLGHTPVEPNPPSERSEGASPASVVITCALV